MTFFSWEDQNWKGFSSHGVHSFSDYTRTWSLGTCPKSPGKAVAQLGDMMMNKAWRPAQRVEHYFPHGFGPFPSLVHKVDLNPGNAFFCSVGGRGVTTSEATPVAAGQGQSRGCALLGGGAVCRPSLGSNVGLWDQKSRQFLLGNTPPYFILFYFYFWVGFLDLFWDAGLLKESTWDLD